MGLIVGFLIALALSIYFPWFGHLCFALFVAYCLYDFCLRNI